MYEYTRREKDSLKHTKSRAKFVSLTQFLTEAIANRSCSCHCATNLLLSLSICLGFRGIIITITHIFHNAVIRILSFFLATQFFFRVVVFSLLFLNPKKVKSFLLLSPHAIEFTVLAPEMPGTEELRYPEEKKIVFTRELLRENVNIRRGKWVISEIRKCRETRLKILPFWCV